MVSHVKKNSVESAQWYIVAVRGVVCCERRNTAGHSGHWSSTSLTRAFACDSDGSDSKLARGWR